MSRSEVPLFQPVGSSHHRLSVLSLRPSHDGSTQFGVQIVGGNFFPVSSNADGLDDSPSGFLWQIDNGPSGFLRMQPYSVSLADTSQLTATELTFDEQLFPSLVLLGGSPGSDRTSSGTVAGLLATGVIFYWDLPCVRSARLSRSAIKFLDLSTQLLRHGTTTALGSAGGNLLLGCSDGTVLGLPRASLASAVQSTTFEMRSSVWGINRLISGVFSSRSTQPAVTVCLPFLLPDGSTEAALIVYEDCTVRAFSLGRGQNELLSDSLSLPATGQILSDTSQQQPKRMIVSSAVSAGHLMFRDGGGGGRAELVVVATLESYDYSSRQSGVFVFGPTTMGGGRMALLTKKELIGVGLNATITSACVDADGDTVWVLAKAHGSIQAAGHSLTTGLPCKSVALHEQLSALEFEDLAHGNAVLKVRF